MSKQFGARKFNQEDYDRCDTYAKEKVMHYLSEYGHKIIQSEEDYKHDIITEKNGHTFYFEVEVKTNYPFTDRGTFPFPTVSFLGRKERLHKIHPFYYLIVCWETDCVVMCHSDDIYKEKYKESIFINTSSRYGSDEMYRVPKEFCTFFCLDEKND